MTYTRETKAKLRERILRLRDSLDPEERKLRSETIADNLMSLTAWKEARVVLLYVSFRSEVETGGIIRRAMGQGKMVAVPFTDYNLCTIIPSALKDPAHDLVPRRFGIMEPREKALMPVSPGEIGLAIIPGCVFDPHGGRIGYGLGCYDRFLPSLSEKSPKVALAFEIQVVSSIPLDKHDCSMDIVVTEQRIIHANLGACR